jgi:thiamine-phosphate pyrophosphorylase
LSVAASLGLGVHLPERGPTVATARHAVGPHVLVGRSVHSPDAARAAGDADYLLAGHVYPTASKLGRPPLGLDGFRANAAAATVPVLAIGGITPANAAAVLAAGAYGVAVVGALLAAPDPRVAAADLRASINQGSLASMASPADQPALRVVANGREATVPPGTTVAGFIASKGLQPKLVVVELNGAILPRDAFAATTLSDGDRLEVVHFVGGG